MGATAVLGFKLNSGGGEDLVSKLICLSYLSHVVQNLLNCNENI